jgi:hypothetical protein
MGKLTISMAMFNSYFDITRPGSDFVGFKQQECGMPPMVSVLGPEAAKIHPSERLTVQKNHHVQYSNPMLMLTSSTSSSSSKIDPYFPFVFHMFRGPSS